MGVQARSRGARWRDGRLGAIAQSPRPTSVRIAARVSLLLLSLAASLVLLAGSALASTGAPINITKPTLGGKAIDEATISATAGRWEGLIPITYKYQGQLCDGAGESCANIAGAVSHKYRLIHGDVGKTLRAIVTGT